MPDLPVDVTVANRFISSLSKSLQALCHGCMDFNTGIEIVGYININIDSGNKADYVLNEKVLKSTTNSMTFVSNSFFAKKEQPKQTRDGACSPIPQYATPSHHWSRGYSHTSHSRYGHYGAHFMRGAQKRVVGNEWRGSAKRHRPVPRGAAQASRTSQAVPNSYSDGSLHGSSSQSHQNTEVASGGVGDGMDNSVLDIKKEALEAVDGTPSHSEGSGQQNNGGAPDLTSVAVNIKSDPDSGSAPGEGNISENTENNDFKGTFLQPQTKDNDNDQNIESEEQGSQKPLSFDTPFPSDETVPASGNQMSDTFSSEPSTSLAAAEEGESEGVVAGPSSNEAMVEYDNATEDSSFAAYSDAGEGSSSGQFEVIEIDDEDEDMQAMFGGAPRLRDSGLPLQFRRFHCSMGQTVGKLETKNMALSQSSITPKCYLCHTSFEDGDMLKGHMLHYHGLHVPLLCKLCGKGYHSQTGLWHHMRLHEGILVPCPKCDLKFTQSSSMRTHLKKHHGSLICSTCTGTFSEGVEFEQHLLLCRKESEIYPYHKPHPWN